MNDDPERVPGPNAGRFTIKEVCPQCEAKSRWAAIWKRAAKELRAYAEVVQADEIDRLKAENERLQELVQLFMAADLARADLDRD